MKSINCAERGENIKEEWGLDQQYDDSVFSFFFMKGLYRKEWIKILNTYTI